MGNPTSWKGLARTFNANNQETTGGGTQFSYDGNGNPTTYKGSTFAFNENDKLTQITTAGTVRLQAGYRSDGLRAWKSTANGTTYFLYDGDQLVCEFDAAGNLATTNIWGANGLMARQNGVSTGSIYYFLWDDRGNIAQLLAAPGNVIVKFTVTAWGERVSDQGSQGALDAYFGLGGQFGNYLDRETGLTLCGQRYYDSGTGRWLNRDPIGTAGGLNVYGYCGNNPVNMIDPEGLENKAGKPTAGIFLNNSRFWVPIIFDTENEPLGVGPNKRIGWKLWVPPGYATTKKSDPDYVPINVGPFKWRHIFSYWGVAPCTALNGPFNTILIVSAPGVPYRNNPKTGFPLGYEGGPPNGPSPLKIMGFKTALALGYIAPIPRPGTKK